MLDANDPRALEVRQSNDDEGVSRFVESLLIDGTLELEASHLALWLVSLFPTRSLIAKTIDVMRERPTLALMAGMELGKLDDPTIFPALEKMLLDIALAPESRVGVTTVLTELRDPRVTPLLIRALQVAVNEPLVVSNVALTLGYVQLRAHSREGAGEIRGLLRSESPDVRFAAITALGNMLAFEAVEDIETLLDDQGVTASRQVVGHRARHVSGFLRSHMPGDGDRNPGL